jgi:hypothetical protein
MPHIGHAPGLSFSTPAHIGQKYFRTAFGGVTGEAALAWSSWQHGWLAEGLVMSLVLNEAT